MTAAFTIPDTICKGVPVNIVNLSQGASTYLWEFCHGDLLANMQGIDLGNPSNLVNIPMAVSLAEDNGNYFAYITNSGSASVMKISWGKRFFNPVFAEDLGTFNLFTDKIFGIQVKYDAGKWYAFVANGNQLIRLNLGASLSADVLSAQVVATSSLMNLARGLVIARDGAGWVGFCTNYPARTITRFTWPGGLGGPNPVVEDLGFSQVLTDPMQPALIQDDQGWHMLVANTNSLVQFDFGSSLSNAPTVTDFKNLAWMTDSRGISLFSGCNNPYGFLSNHNVVQNLILQINFSGGIMGNKTVTPLGSAANLYLPTGLSESVNIRDTIYAIALNESSVTTLFFPPCVDFLIPSSHLFDPSPVIFPEGGKYTVKLMVDQGLPTEQSVCKVVYADDPATVSLGNDTSLCPGGSVILDAGSGFAWYKWSTGEKTQVIRADTAGIYIVEAANTNVCPSGDTIVISMKLPVTAEVDTAICYGERYFAGGAWRTRSGIYRDTLTAANRCDSVVITNLSVKSPVDVRIENDTCIFSDETLILKAIADPAAVLTWQDGSHSVEFQVSEPGPYRVTAMLDGCSGYDSATVKSCPALVYFPSAFTPNGDGLNDTFQPGGRDIGTFHMIIFDRWGTMVFETSDPRKGWDGMISGNIAETGIYIFSASFTDKETPGQPRTVSGSFTLLR